jgi:hypothetical protein
VAAARRSLGSVLSTAMTARAAWRTAHHRLPAHLEAAAQHLQRHALAWTLGLSGAVWVVSSAPLAGVLGEYVPLAQAVGVAALLAIAALQVVRCGERISGSVAPPSDADCFRKHHRICAVCNMTDKAVDCACS